MYNIILDKKNIDIKIINRRRIRKVTLSVKDGKVIVVKPYYTSIEYVKDMIYASKEKILKYIDDTSSKVTFEDGTKLLYLGKEYSLHIVLTKSNKASATLENKTITIYINDKDATRENIKKIYIKLLKDTTKSIIEKKLETFSKITNIKYESYKIRYMTTRWGSCVSNNRTLNFNAKIAMLPDNVIDSIVVHELCHIVEANHKKEFWNLVYKYIPDYDKCSNWLKVNNYLINI